MLHILLVFGSCMLVFWTATSTMRVELNASEKAKEEGFLQAFPESSDQEIGAAVMLEKALQELKEADQEFYRKTEAFKTATQTSRIRNRCCEQEAEAQEKALTNCYHSSLKVLSWTDIFLDNLEENEDYGKKVSWLKKRLRKVGIEIHTRPRREPGTIVPRSPAEKHPPGFHLLYLIVGVGKIEFPSHEPESCILPLYYTPLCSRREAKHSLAKWWTSIRYA